MNMTGELAWMIAMAAEMVMKKQLYKSDKKLKLRIDVKKKFVYDRNARLTILLGVPLCTLLCGFVALFMIILIR